MPHQKIRIVLLGLAAVLFFGGPSLVLFYTDWLWFGEVSFEQVFLTSFKSQALVFIGTFVVAVAWLAGNLRVALAGIGDARPVFVTREGIRVALPAGRQLRTLTMAVGMLLAAAVALFASARWQLWLTWWYAVPFGEADPILGRDVGFYVFALPFWQFLRGLAQALVVLAALTSGALYLVAGNMTAGFPATMSLAPAARRHLAVLGAVFFVLLASGAWLQRAEYLVEPAGVIFGANYADVHARLPVSLVLVAACLAGAGLALMQATSARRLWPIGAALGVYLLVSIAGEAYATAIQRFVVTPNEDTRETPYIEHNIAATRRAFALDAVEALELSGDALLTEQDIANNAPTLENVRLWDHEPLLETFGQIQEIRTYYEFASVDNDRYMIDGSLRQVMLSARELNSNSLPNRTWINERLTFTHGYGITLGPVNRVTEEGLPVLFVQDLPPVTSAGLTVDQPSIYFGELSSNYVVVRTRTREFHYPRGNDNVFTQYDGQGGLLLDSLWRKAIFALRFGAYQLILADDITPESRIIFNRNIGERVRRIAPFLAFDRDPYLVLAEGRLYWLYDAYTTSARYPYSTPVGNGRLNYIRNSVKFVIDAYNGTTTAYLADDADPIVATYARIFPQLFTPLAEMPASLRAHVRYPEDIFAIQSQVFTTYHMTQPNVFYNREDQWEVPTIDEAGEARQMQPYYTIMRLPGEPSAEFIQMLPFVPRGRDNLAAWLVARSDGEHYGRMRVFQFPKQKLVFGPRQVVNRITQDQEIAPQITLWSQQGSRVIWGTLMVIPIEESLVYVRPLYLRASGGRIPELTRVIVAYQNQIVMEPTLDAALARLFSGPDAGSRAPAATLTTASPAPGAAPPAGASAPSDAADPALAARAREHYERALAAQRAGNWAAYGEEIRQLGEVLERMRTR